MARGTLLTQQEKDSILDLRKKGRSYGEIAKEIKRSKCAVHNFLNNSLNNRQKKRVGRKKKLSDRQRRSILRTASNRSISSSGIKNQLGLNVSRWTVNRVLQSAPNLVLMKKKKSPPLKPIHKENRLGWAKDHMTWNQEWKNVVWSDEKKFNFDGPDGFSYYWHDIRKEEQLFSKRNQGGGSVMVWASFGWNGKSEICFIDERMNAENYRQLLNDHLTHIGSTIGGDKWIFQQDNAPIHRANANINWFKSRKIDVLPWPAYSPDLNPIENLWGILVRKVYEGGRQFYRTNDLKKAIEDCWAKIELHVLQNLVESMPNRIFQVIRLNGAKTKY